MDNGELAAVLFTDTLPLKVPVVVGAKLTLKPADWPTARVTGRANPVTPK